MASSSSSTNQTERNDIQRALHTSRAMFQYVNENFFESEPWKIKSAHSDRTFYIHEGVLRSSCSTLYAVCNRMWRETQERVYQFDGAVSEQVISCFLNYAYYRNYSPSLETLGLGPTETTGSSNSEEGADPLLLHGEVYVFADTYLMSGLGSLAQLNIKNHINRLGTGSMSEEDRESVLNLIEYAFDNLREDDPFLLFLAEYASFRLDQLRLSDRLGALLSDPDGKFLKLLLPRLSGTASDPLAYLNENTQGPHVPEASSTSFTSTSWPLGGSSRPALPGTSGLFGSAPAPRVHLTPSTSTLRSASISAAGASGTPSSSSAFGGSFGDGASRPPPSNTPSGFGSTGVSAAPPSSGTSSLFGNSRPVEGSLAPSGTSGFGSSALGSTSVSTATPSGALSSSGTSGSLFGVSGSRAPNTSSSFGSTGVSAAPSPSGAPSSSSASRSFGSTPPPASGTSGTS